MNWLCKICTFTSSKRLELLKHYRLQHGHHSRNQSIPCLHSDCPCTFRTWGALQTHLSRFHPQTTRPGQLLSFTCIVIGMNPENCNEQHDNLLELTKCICFYYFQQEDELEDHTNEIMKLVVIHNPTVEENPADVCVVIEGIKVLTGCGNRTTACILLMGLIYAFNLEYPKNLKYTF